jgi:hypothetical protein
MEKIPDKVKYLSPLEILNDIDWGDDTDDDIIPLRKFPNKSITLEAENIISSTIDNPLTLEPKVEDIISPTTDNPITSLNTKNTIPLVKKKMITNNTNYGYKSKLDLLSKREEENTTQHKKKVGAISQKTADLKQELEIKLRSLIIQEQKADTEYSTEQKRIDRERKKIASELKDKLCLNGNLIACVLRKSDKGKFYAEQIPYIDKAITIDLISPEDGLKIEDVIFTPYKPFEDTKIFSSNNKIDGYMLGGIVIKNEVGELYFMMST